MSALSDAVNALILSLVVLGIVVWALWFFSLAFDALVNLGSSVWEWARRRR